MPRRFPAKSRVFIRMILAALLRRRSRMPTALAAVAIGSTALAGLFAVHRDIPRQLEREFRSYGANLLLLPSGGLGAMDMAALAEAARILPREKTVGVTPYRYESLSLNRQPVTAAGLTFEQARHTSPYWRLEGEWPGNADELAVGVDVAEAAGLSIGARASVSGRTRRKRRFSAEMTVTGLIRSGGAEDRMIFMELPVMERLTGLVGEVNLAEASVAASEEELKELTAAIRSGVKGVEPRLVRRVAGSETAVLAKLRALTFLVSAVTLVLILICVATAMMAAVLERRREIALKKALGAENSAIALEFLGEGVALGLLGGLIGSGAGFFFARILGQSVFGRPAAMDPWNVPATLLAAAAVTAAACVFPILRTVKIDPAVVLRGE